MALEKPAGLQEFLNVERVIFWIEQHAVQSRTPTMLGVNHLAKLEINLSDFLMRVDIAFYFRGGANVVRTAAGDRVER
jgi:hypothetical protein